MNGQANVKRSIRGHYHLASQKLDARRRGSRDETLFLLQGLHPHVLKQRRPAPTEHLDQAIHKLSGVKSGLSWEPNTRPVLARNGIGVHPLGVVESDLM